MGSPRLSKEDDGIASAITLSLQTMKNDDAKKEKRMEQDRLQAEEDRKQERKYRDEMQRKENDRHEAFMTQMATQNNILMELLRERK